MCVCFINVCMQCSRICGVHVFPVYARMVWHKTFTCIRFFSDCAFASFLQTFLGLKVEKELERQQRDRKDRRHAYGEIEFKQTQRFGKLCSPYQALATPVSG